MYFIFFTPIFIRLLISKYTYILHLTKIKRINGLIESIVSILKTNQVPSKVMSLAIRTKVQLINRAYMMVRIWWTSFRMPMYIVLSWIIFMLTKQIESILWIATIWIACQYIFKVIIIVNKGFFPSIYSNMSKDNTHYAHSA